MGITQELAGYCSRMRFNDLSDEVIDCAKYRFLDFISVACRGSIADPSRTVYRFVREMDKGQGVIVGTRAKAPYLYSALANGTSAHAIEMDDVNNEASLHPGVVVFPAALATAEMVGETGKRFILAVVLGYEVMVRLGSALGPENSYKRGFHPTGTCGTFGASVASSKILGLQEEQILNAMGISGSQAAGSMEYLAQGAWTKPFHAGWAAHSGMLAALLSGKGFKGPASILEGRDGFLHAYSGKADPSKVLEGIGSGFQILRTSVKPHACCRYMQPPIDAVLKIVNENNLRPEQVKKIKVGVLKAGAPLIAEPIEIKVNPQSIVDAQFSMPFGAAAALLYGRAGLKEFQPSTIRSRPVREMMQKVECIVDPELDRTFPKQWRASAEILTADEKRYSTTVEYPLSLIHI
jgi:2-methylcitrate dehydratase PrpD